MTTTPDTPTPPPSEPGPPAPRRFLRSSADRIIGGVCGGLGRYFGIDSTLVRIAFIALALLGGTGLVIYAAALLLVPDDGEVPPSPTSTRDRAIAAAAAIALTIAGFSLGLFGGFGFGGALVPVAFLALAGLAVWWFVSGERPSGSPGDVLRRALLGFGLLVGCAALAAGSFLASGLGGGVVVAGLVIAAGAGLVAGAFVGGARWLVLPALAIALPLAFVSAAGIDLEGGFGQRKERPATLTELHGGYRLGAGELVVDLRDLELPAGDHRGIDVDWHDGRRAPAGTPRLVVDGDVGLGLLEVRHHDDTVHGRGLRPDRADERNAACTTTTASTKPAGASHG
jgi:phage shock protein PspC (stress-responsive transcriptional regulator)